MFVAASKKQGISFMNFINSEKLSQGLAQNHQYLLGFSLNEASLLKQKIG